MRTRFSRMTLSIVALLALALPSTRADEAADLYLEGFKAWHAGAALEKEGKRADALIKLCEALEKISDVQLLFPDWQPKIVQYRLTVIRKKLAEVSLPQSPEHPAAPAPPAPDAPAPRRS
jgi:hypothetical protein